MHVSVLNVVVQLLDQGLPHTDVMWILYFVNLVLFLVSFFSTRVIYNPPCRKDPGARVGFQCRRRRINGPYGDLDYKRFSASPCLWMRSE
jgi:hypothetical protein